MSKLKVAKLQYLTINLQDYDDCQQSSAESSEYETEFDDTNLKVSLFK